MALTREKIRKLNVSDLNGSRSRMIPDGNGLYLRISLNRGNLSKAWVVRLQGKKGGVKTIAPFDESHPDHLSVGDAREQAILIKAQLKSGKRASRDERPDGVSIIELLNEWHGDLIERNPGSGWNRTVGSHIRNWIDGSEIADLDVRDFDLGDAVSFVKSAHKKGASADLATKLFQHLSAAFAFAAEPDRKWIDASPLAGAKNPFKKIQTKERDDNANAPLSIEQIQHLLNNIWDYPDRNHGLRHYRYGILLMLATGLRSIEVARLRWKYVSRNRRGDWELDIPGFEGKDRVTKNGFRHVIPVTDWMLDNIIEPLRDITGDSKWIIPHADDFGHGYASTQLTAKRLQDTITKNAELQFDNNNKWHAHCLRSTVINLLTELGVKDDINRSIVNHVEGDAQQRYVAADAVGKKVLPLTQYHAALEAIKVGAGYELFASLQDATEDPIVAKARELAVAARRKSIAAV